MMLVSGASAERAWRQQWAVWAPGRPMWAATQGSRIAASVELRRRAASFLHSELSPVDRNRAVWLLNSAELSPRACLGLTWCSCSQPCWLCPGLRISIQNQGALYHEDCACSQAVRWLLFRPGGLLQSTPQAPFSFAVAQQKVQA